MYSRKFVNRGRTEPHGMTNRRPRTCSDAAWSRAIRYARRRRIARQLLPLIAAALLFMVLLERGSNRFSNGVRTRRARQEAIGTNSGAGRLKECDNLDGDAMAYGTDTGGMARGEPAVALRPPSHFLAKDISQIVAYLIRNKARVDNEAVRMKWAILDQVALPLAVYLRDIEANGAWGDLQEELSYAHVSPETLDRRKPGQFINNLRILALLPEWTGRGEVRLALLESVDAEQDRPILEAVDANSGLAVDDPIAASARIM